MLIFHVSLRQSPVHFGGQEKTSPAKVQRMPRPSSQQRLCIYFILMESPIELQTCSPQAVQCPLAFCGRRLKPTFNKAAFKCAFFETFYREYVVTVASRFVPVYDCDFFAASPANILQPTGTIQHYRLSYYHHQRTRG